MKPTPQLLKILKKFADNYGLATLPHSNHNSSQVNGFHQNNKMLVLRSPAKVNLCLDVLRKSPDGYHEIATVLCIAENYFDEITIEATEKEDVLSIISGPQNHTSERIDKSGENLLSRAVSLMKNEAALSAPEAAHEKFAKIIVNKNLPFSSGLGALSSNAATIMMGLNELWDLQLSKEKLKTLGAQLGMDVPFFFEGGICLGTHFGELVEPIKTDLKFEIEVDPRTSSEPEKTKRSFEKIDLTRCGKNNDKTSAFIKALKENNKAQALRFLHNDFEQLYPELEKAVPRRRLAGSGPSIFTIKGFI